MGALVFLSFQYSLMKDNQFQGFTSLNIRSFRCLNLSAIIFCPETVVCICIHLNARQNYSICNIGFIGHETGLSPPVKYFTDRSKAVLLLWIIYVFLSCVCYAFMCVYAFMPCGHLLGKG